MHVQAIGQRRLKPGIEERVKQGVGKQWSGIGNKESGGGVALFIDNRTDFQLGDGRRGRSRCRRGSSRRNADPRRRKDGSGAGYELSNIVEFQNASAPMAPGNDQKDPKSQPNTRS